VSRFVPITKPDDLPKPGEGYERATLDLKTTAVSRPGFHHAKDVAAFANHLGGTLVIGAQESAGRVGQYVPLTETSASAIQAAFSQAVRDRCSPRPLIDFVRVAIPGGVVLAVNVWPYIGQVVGVRVKCDKSAEGFGDDAYVFPMRVGVDSAYLLPEQLPMLMLPEVRRVAVLLQGIANDSQVEVIVLRRSPERPPAVTYTGTVESIDEVRNRVVFSVAAGGGYMPQAMPLDHVETVFEQRKGHWRVVVRSFG
jgi:hypothetical protein